jgi:hypothetical protein
MLKSMKGVVSLGKRERMMKNESLDYTYCDFV